MAATFTELRFLPIRGFQAFSATGRRQYHDTFRRRGPKLTIRKEARSVHSARRSSTTAWSETSPKNNPEFASQPVPAPKLSSQHPLSCMPLGMLLRSLMVSTVSSNRSLLIPSLKVLEFLVQSNSKVLLNVQKNPVLHGILKKTIYDQFCTGETVPQTISKCQSLKDLGFKGVILTYAREIHYDHKAGKAHGMGTLAGGDATTAAAIKDADIEAWRAGNLKTLECICEGDILAIKTTGAGHAVAEAFTIGNLPPQQMLEALFEIGQICKDRGIRIIIDAESQHFQDGIDRTAVKLMRKFNRDGKVTVYNTYQAYLKRTPSVIARHLEEAAKNDFTLGLKLVRGAYILSEDRSLIHDTIEDTHNAYNGIVAGALTRNFGGFGAESPKPFPSVHLFIASHNRESVMKARKLHCQRIKDGLPTVPLAFGQLHGMSDEVRFSLLQQKDDAGKSPEVFKCSTWGTMSECIAYLLRRAVENRDAVLRTSDELRALKHETKRRFKALFSA